MAEEASRSRHGNQSRTNPPQHTQQHKQTSHSLTNNGGQKAAGTTLLPETGVSFAQSVQHNQTSPASSSRSFLDVNFQSSNKCNKQQTPNSSQDSIACRSPTMTSHKQQEPGPLYQAPSNIKPPNQLPRSPSPRYRHRSDSASPPNRSPVTTSPTPPGTPNNRTQLLGDTLPDSDTGTSITIGSSTGADEGNNVTASGGGDSSVSGVSDGAEAAAAGKVERKPKSVSFHSHTNWKSERKVQSAADCLEAMKDGSSLIKVRSSGRQYHRYFRLLDDLSAIHWTPSSKKLAKAQVGIDQIHEVRTGRNCESLRHQQHPLRYPEERIFSILYGPAYQSLDLIAHTPEEATIWVTGLNALIGDANSPDMTDGPQGCLREKWLQSMFEQCSSSSGGGAAPSGCCDHHGNTIDQHTSVALIQSLDPNVEADIILHKIQEYDLGKSEACRGRVDSSEFIRMFKEVATRHEISCLLIRFANKDYLTLEDLQLFLEGEQALAGLTEAKVREVIDKYEPSPEARKSAQLHVDGFTKYLLSEECDIFEPRHRSVCQDMTQPLTHYFISSSHNTYLLEDQLKGPSSVDGFIRVLTCGCRCVKVDVYDGPTEPLVYHGNTLTSRVFFRDVLDAIATYSFDFSVYPVIVHLENHCSVGQQKLMVDLITTILGALLYRPPPDSAKNSTCALSPHALRNKVLLKGKKLANEDVSEGEVTDEDEGGAGSDGKAAAERKTVPLWSELSKLISITRGRHTDRGCNAECQSLSESSASRFSHNSPEELVSLNKHILTRVYPNTSRVDSSNYNPQDFWNAGCQLVSLNFQTPGQMMDVYEGKFRCNGGCGYVLKPAVMREHISVFSAATKDAIPGVTAQVLKIKVISAQSLPKPRGSTASKASFLDPYVVIQVFGIPADCREYQTRTVKNNSRFPVFDESFDIELQLPELALVRFVVLDDEYIGDDFIGQCTVPVTCMQTGYRHIRLLSCMGEPMEHVTLFVHVAVSSSNNIKAVRVRGARKNSKSHTDLKVVGLKQADEMFKDAGSKLAGCGVAVSAVEAAWKELQQECGLELTANMKQCLKVSITRFLTHPDNYSLTIVTENGVPFLKRSPSGPLPTYLQKLETALDQLLQEISTFLNGVDGEEETLRTCLEPALSLYDTLDAKLNSNGVKGKKANKARENFAWNVRIIRGQLDRLAATRDRCRVALEQVESTRNTLSSLNRRDRSPSVRDRSRLTLANRHHTTDNLSNYGSLGRSPVSPSHLLHPDQHSQQLYPVHNALGNGKPKSILKKSNSNIESGSMTYVVGDGGATEREYYNNNDADDDDYNCGGAHRSSSSGAGGTMLNYSPTSSLLVGPPSPSCSSVVDDEEEEDDNIVEDGGLFLKPPVKASNNSSFNSPSYSNCKTNTAL